LKLAPSHLEKIHLKKSVGDRLSLCGIWPGSRFVSMTDFEENAPADRVCKICIQCLSSRQKINVPPPPGTQEGTFLIQITACYPA